jgi:RNA polymerase sigma-70 factor (ECF subfamily)
MPGREGSEPVVRTVTYCLMPLDLASRLHETLRRHFGEDPDIEVIVEWRSRERRRLSERRLARGDGPSGRERRRIRAASGRRVGERRAALVAVDALALPRKARPHAARLSFAERLEPSGSHSEDADTARLVTRIQAGDGDAFALLYLRYFDRVYSYLRLMLSNAHDAEDVAQRVFVRVLEALPRYERRSQPFRAWLFTLARNHALNELRDTKRIELTGVELPQAEAEETGEPDELRALEWISDQDLQVFISRLPLAQRQVLFLRYVVGLSSAETAAVLEQSLEAVRKHHSRAMRFLRDRLVALGRDPRRKSRRVGAALLPRRAVVVRLRRFSLL